MQPATADDTIVLAAPFSGPFGAIGQQFSKVSQATTAPAPARIVEIDTQCSPELAEEIAISILSTSAKHVVGFPCIDVFDAVVATLVDADLIITVVGLQSKDITKDRAPSVRRMAPSDQQIAERLVRFIAAEWRDEPIAIIDDGTLSGRRFASNVQVALNKQTITPVFTDTYRPLLENQSSLIRRLERAGVTKVVLGGDAFDAALMSSDAERLQVDLQFAGGPALIAPSTDGTLADGSIIASALPLPELLAKALSAITENTDGGQFYENGEPTADLTALFTVENGVAKRIQIQTPAGG
ncbi:MAG: ABC transporter substrate-binding protein [Pseudomonadota bacterium]